MNVNDPNVYKNTAHFQAETLRHRNTVTSRFVCACHCPVFTAIIQKNCMLSIRAFIGRVIPLIQLSFIQ